MFIKLSGVQAKAIHRAYTNKTGFTLKLTKKQVLSASDESVPDASGTEGGVNIPLNKVQQRQMAGAKAANTGLALTFTKTQCHRIKSEGGFFSTLIPMIMPVLEKLAPIAIKAAPEILKNIKEGFAEKEKDPLKTRVIKKVTGSSLETFGSGVYLLDGSRSGSSLKIFGEGEGGQKKGLRVPGTMY